MTECIAISKLDIKIRSILRGYYDHSYIGLNLNKERARLLEFALLGTESASKKRSIVLNEIAILTANEIIERAQQKSKELMLEGDIAWCGSACSVIKNGFKVSRYFTVLEVILKTLNLTENLTECL